MKPLFIAVATVLAPCAPAAQAQVPTSTNAVGPYYATPAWDQKLPSATRFIVLSNWGHQAMLDRETGLVWKLELEEFRFPQLASQSEASGACVGAGAGDRAGWRLPTIQELMRTVHLGRTLLPADTPFGFLLGKTLWSSTGSGTQGAWTVQIWPQGYITPRPALATSIVASAWCVQSPAAGAAVQ